MARMNGWDHRPFEKALAGLRHREALDHSRRFPQDTTGRVTWGEHRRIPGVLPGCLCARSGGRAQAPAAVPGGEVGGLSRRHRTGDLAGGRGSEVGRRCQRDHPVARVGERCGAGHVRLRPARASHVDGGCRAGAAAFRERSAPPGSQGARGRAHASPGKAALGLFGGRIARESAQTTLELLGLIHAAIAHVRAHRWRALGDQLP